MEFVIISLYLELLAIHWPNKG